MIHITCGNRTPVIPKNGCSDCEQLEERVEALEQCCEDVNAALDEKADETEIQEIMNIINGLGAAWHYVGDIEDSEHLPDFVTEGDAYYDVSTGSWYIAKEDIPSGAVIGDFFFVSGNDYTLHTATSSGNVVIQLTDSHNNTSSVKVAGTAPISVSESSDTITVSHDDSGVTAGSKGDTTNQTPDFGDTVKSISATVDAKGHVTALGEHTVKIPDTLATDSTPGLMSPADKDKVDHMYDLYDTECGDPAEIENAEEANFKSVVVSLEPHQAGTPWQDSTIYQTPYLFRKTPSINHSINSKYTTLVGADVAMNQLVQNGNFASGSSNWAGRHGTTSVSGGVCTVAITETGTNTGLAGSVKMPEVIAGHKYLMMCSTKSPVANTIAMSVSGGATAGGASNKKAIAANTWTDVAVLWYYGSNIANAYPYLIYENNVYTVGQEIQYKNVQYIDLTAYFGSSTIADTAYTKEQSQAGSGIAWLKANGFDFSKYRAFNAGSLESVNPSAIVDRGFNQWDEEWENGRINVNTGADASGNGVRSKNYIRILPNTAYHAVRGDYTGGVSFTLIYYDAGQNYIGYDNKAGTSVDFTTPTNAYYMRFNIMTSAAVTTYNHDICINISKPTGTPKNGDYRAYSEHEYALGNVPLHGLFKLVDGNIQAVGDTRDSQGNVGVNYGAITLDGSQNFDYIAVDTETVRGRYDMPDMRANNTTEINILSTFPTYEPDYIYSNDVEGISENKNVSSNAFWIRVKKSSLSEASQAGLKAFFTAHPLEVIYPLKTPTTDTADPFTNPQVVDNWGTEEFVTSNDVPVGNETRYADVYEITGTDEVTVTVADDPDNPTTSEDYTTALGQTVYEGTVDVVRGKLTVTEASKTINGTESNVWYTSNGTNKQTIYTEPSFLPNVKTTAGSGYQQTARFSNFVTAKQLSEAVPWTAYIDVGWMNMIFPANTFGGTSIEVKNWLKSHNVQVVYELATPIEIDLTPTDIEALLGDNYVWSEQGRVCVTYMMDKGDLTEELSALEGCCDTCDGGCDSDTVIDEHIVSSGSIYAPLTPLIPGVDTVYKITVNGNTVIKESALYEGMWLWAVSNNIELFYDENDGWMALANSGEYDIKVETVCNQPLYVNLSASPLDSTQEIVMDKTFKEIENAYSLGKTVIVRYSSYQHYTPLQVCYDVYAGRFVSIHGYDVATSTFDIFPFRAVMEDDYPTYSV